MDVSENVVQSWQFEQNFQMWQPEKACHKTAITHNSRCNTFIEKWKLLISNNINRHAFWMQALIFKNESINVSKPFALPSMEFSLELQVPKNFVPERKSNFRVCFHWNFCCATFYKSLSAICFKITEIIYGKKEYWKILW